MTSSIPSSPVPLGSCSHLNAFKTSSNLTSLYAKLLKCLLAPSDEASRAKAAQSLACSHCGGHRNNNNNNDNSNTNNSSNNNSLVSRLHVCLHCVHLACFPTHWEAHQHKEKTHVLSLESQHGNIHCGLCKDFVYDPELDSMAAELFSKSSRSLGLGTLHRSWRPSPEEVALLRKNRKRKGFSSSGGSSNNTLGLRGLVNLGNTCFMSCIVQSLIHTPLLRDYFLSDRHICMLEDGPEQCIVCEMSRLFQEFYSGVKTPLVPHVLLHMTWTHAHHLAGYEQQDAHEFFIATLDLLHRHLIHRTDANPSNCDCIVDTVFTGKLQSDVVCQACKNVSTTIDPFWDISLDLPATPGAIPSAATRDTGASTATTAAGSSSSPISLQHCLERFTKPEHLGSSAKIICSICKSYQESTKQLTMKKLPIVASFHLKRFEHSSRFHKKISTRVAFPEFLDMSPFVSHIRNNHSNQPEMYSSPVRNNTYTLIAVINHLGNIEAGHYTSYVRQHRERWYRCNDHQIVPTTIQEVLDSEGYLLFYHKQALEYK